MSSNKIIKSYIICVGLLMWGGNILHAQQSLQDTLSHLTWNDVSEITMRHHQDILVGEQEVLNAQKERDIKTAELFPIIKGTGNIRHNIKIQQTPDRKSVV